MSARTNDAVPLPANANMIHDGQQARGLINAPKRQPCPKCKRWVKRQERFVGLAMYACPMHGRFEISLKVKR